MPLGPKLPFFSALEPCQTILLAGAGGGYDIFTGLPLFFQLIEAGKTVHLANLSFSQLEGSDAKRMAPALYEVTAKTVSLLSYFPEFHLAQWLRTQGIERPIYCIPRTGTRPTIAAYRFLAEELRPDAIVLVDGGTDSLMRGDEIGLGTPCEDSSSLAAAAATDVPVKLLMCLGFGIDTFHGVCHASFLEAVSDLSRQGAFLGTWSLLNEQPEVQLYDRAIQDVFRAMPQTPSIVNSSILSAIRGEFGDHHATRRTEGSRLFINPLMSLYWTFRLEAVARRNLYLDQIRESETFIEQEMAIERFRDSLDRIRPWIDLPM